MKTYFIILIFAFSFLILFAFKKSTDDSFQKSGKDLFNKMCINWHGVNTTKTGPPFQRIRNVHGKEWVYKFMKCPACMLNKDEISKRMHQKFKQIMPSYILTKAEVDAICDYVDSFPYNPNSKDYDYRRK